MFRYSWKCINKYCNKDVDKIISILRCYDTKIMTIPQANLINKIAKCGNKNGYILNLKGLLADKEASKVDKVIYLYVASKRNVLDYAVYGRSSLNIKLAGIDVSKVEHNPLFVFDDNNIYFKY